MFRTLTCFACLLFATVFIVVCAQGATTETGITFESHGHEMGILVDGAPFATYVWEDDVLPRPYFAQLHAPGGEQVTRNYPPHPVHDRGNDDHGTYHPGLWLAFGDINGADFWRLQARVRHIKFLESPVCEKGVATFTVLNQYEGGDGKEICRERCRYTLRKTEWGFLLQSESTFIAGEHDVRFGDQEEMGLGFRLATDLRVAHGDGTLRNSAGGENEKGTWGKEAAWCAGYGVRGANYVGAILMPHPDNFRGSWFHSRDYGLVTANPFGKKAMTGPHDGDVKADSTLVKKGETLELAFGVGFFSLLSQQDVPLEAMYRDYLKKLAAP